MPYINAEARQRLMRYKFSSIPRSAGELNYLLTFILLDYYKMNPKYQSINDILGALEGAKLEFYRRIAAPYEDNKMEINGDVYPSRLSNGD